MANQLRLDTTGMESILAKLARLEHEAAKSTLEESMSKIAEKVNADTHAAIAPGNLPRRGKYSHGDTAASIESDTSVRWEGFVAWVPVGFDFSKPGAGGYLITGTPRMAPDRELRRMYRQKAYMKGIQEELWEEISNHISEIMEG